MSVKSCIAAGAAILALLGATTTSANELRRVAFLGVEFQNDNEGYEPTNDAERARIAALERQFTEQLAQTGIFAFLPLSAATRETIAKGQPLGSCGGCETDFGKKAGAGEVAWIKVQKVSNLILNMNVYMLDVNTQKPTFVHSVDIRGNTDEMWQRSLTYLIKNYLRPTLEPQATGPGL